MISVVVDMQKYYNSLIQCLRKLSSWILIAMNKTKDRMDRKRAIIITGPQNTGNNAT